MFEGTRTSNQRRSKLVRRNAATRTSSQSISKKMRRNSTGCFRRGAEFLEFVTVLNKPGTNPRCRERTDCPQALAGHPRALCTGFAPCIAHSGRASVLGKARSRPRGSFLLSRSEARNSALPAAWMCPVDKENTETWYGINSRGVMTAFVQICLKHELSKLLWWLKNPTPLFLHTQSQQGFQSWSC